MMPTPAQIERARLVALWRRRVMRTPGTHWTQYDPFDQMELLGREWFTDDVIYNSPPDRLKPSDEFLGCVRRLANTRRPQPTPHDLEMPDDFPY